MDLGEIGVILVAEGEAEARSAIERFVRARDAAVRSMDEAAQREVRSAQAIERAIQKEIREYENLLRTASSLRRSYEDLVASFNPLNRAQLEYARGLEMLDAALAAEVINEQQRARAVELLRQRMEAIATEDVSKGLEEVARKTAESTREIQDAQRAYDELLASIDPMVGAQQKYERSIDTLNQAVAKNIISSEERVEIEKRLQAQLAKDQSTIRAAQSRQETREIEKNKLAHAQLVGELERLRASVNPVIRQQQLYDQALKTTSRAVREKIISEKESIRIMEDVRQKMASMGHIVNQNGEVMSRADTAWQRWARGGVQNAGYQIADFAVQVQGGTSALVAFGQQAPQFLGMFGAIGAALGAVVAVAAAVVNIFVLTRNSIKDADEQLKQLGSTLTRLEDIRLSDIGRDLADQALIAKQRFSDILSVMERVETMKLRENIRTSLGQVEEEIRKFDFRQSITGAWPKILPFEKDAFESELGLKNREDAVFVAIQLRRIDGETREELQRQLESVTESLRVRELLTEEVQKLLAGVADELDILGTINEEANSLLKAEEERQNAAKRTREELERLEELTRREMRTAGEMLSILVNEEEIHRKIYQYGENSAEVEELRKRHARDAYFAKINQLGVDLEIRQMLMDQYDATQGAAESAKSFAEESARARKELEPIVAIFASIKNQIDSLSLSNIGRAARLAALRSGGSDAEASLAEQIAVERAKLSPALGSSETAIRIAAQQQLDERIAGLVEQARIEKEISDILEDRRSSENTSDGGASQQEDVIAALVRRIQLERSLLGLSQTEKEVREAAARSEINYTEAYIQSAIRIIDVNRQIIDQRRDFESIGETIEKSMGDAMMSIVDGTKTLSDAFKEMARLIIADIYRVVVVKQILSGVSGASADILSSMFGFTPNANGNVFSTGSVVPYADGGVVSSPTLFPMRGGVGLMGEAGPEAILPLRRNSSGKLGVAAEGAGAVTVVQNFSVSANGDESVKRIIRGEMPAFAEAAKAAVIDARRRGGAMRAAFT